MSDIEILGLCGSLRRQSFNAAALQAVGELLPDGLRLRQVGLQHIPLFDQDIEARGLPPAVEALQQQILSARGVLIASPEYNFSVPGVLKNAIDWLSRTRPQPFRDKPVALLSATLGPVGGARSQYELRKVLGCLEALVLPKPEVFIGSATQKFDAEGRLSDPASRQVLADQLKAFAAWIRRMEGTK